MRQLRRSGFFIPSALTAALWLKGRHPQVPGWGCPFRALTGIPGPGCYLTRATSAALNGDFQLSLGFHLFGPIVAAALLGWSLMALRKRRLIPVRVALAPMSIITSAFVLYWLLRLVLSYGFGVVGSPGFPATG
ncbi:DUF2752 domain-containing protein [Synechococcus sp. CC9311]|uniref:DUF2752 domain-containing protein n=1 Tax=Synechococcus sp. (strain CC9311) TaxID=64471 RepID=UPI0000DDB32B|nr:DUF2752 domain-containing protein [Synechococcus sp. CC9311]ABI45357.1 hypothetical protein sync_2649 [Synechococcus sp. CC9311]